MIDVVQVLESIGVDIHNVGDREVSAFCPVHEKYLGRPNTNTPAFSMSLQTGAWICYSCGASGSLPSLVEEVTGDSATDLAKLIRRETNKKAVEARLFKSEEAPVQEVVADEFTYKALPAVPAKLLALRRLDPEVAHDYGVRWNPDRKVWVLPVRQHDGQLLGWQERNRGYFCNVPKGMRTHQSGALFGWDQVRDHTMATVVESPLDVVRLAGVGVPNPVSTFGANASPEQLERLRGFRRVVIAYDNDAPGRNGAVRIATFLGPKARWFDYAGDPFKDPGDYEDDDLLVKRWVQARNVMTPPRLRRVRG